MRKGNTTNPPCTFSKMTPEERSYWGKIGSQKAHESRRRKKEFKETLEILLSMSVKKGRKTDVDDVKCFADLKGKNVTVDQALMVTLINKALHGDLSAITTIRDTVGEKPVENVNVDAILTKNPFDDLTVDELRELIAKGDDGAE